MNPHRFSWGFAFTLPLAMAAAAVTFVSVLFRVRQLKFPRTRETYLFILLWIFITITSYQAFYPDEAWIKWETISKIYLMTLFAMLLTTTRDRLEKIMLTIVISIGFIGIKGAIFGFLTGGEYKVWGPPESFLEDNNDLALAMVMTVPLCLSLRETMKKKWQSYSLLGAAFSMIVAAVLTYSRGALLGLAAIGLFYFLWAKPKQKAVIALVSVVAIPFGLKLLPPQWFDRMNTIKTYEDDGSANMRLNSWKMSFNLASDNLLGGGFECFSLQQYYRYSPNPDIGAATTAAGAKVGSTAHSIYFEVMATQGFIGLTLYLICLLSILLSLLKLCRIAKYIPDGAWIASYGRGLGVSIVGFMVNGAFLSRAFFDLFWAIFAAAICLKWIVYSGAWIENDEKVLQDVQAPPADIGADGTIVVANQGTVVN
jgi:probable O-glycosylation ligase (exosortase A-associated)